MTTRVSPGVYPKEISVSDTVPAASPMVGAFVGKAQWGPVDETRLLTSEDDLVQYFGKPTADTYKDFLMLLSSLGNQ